MQLIPVVTADRVATIDGVVSGLSGSVSRTCLADVYDEQGDLHLVYLKVSSPHKTILAGDLVRWLLASVMSIPVPEHAMLVQVPLEMLEPVCPELPWRDWWQRELIPGFATTGLKSVTPPTPISLNADGILIDELQSWRGLHPTMALDEWLANVDDNLSNILQLIRPDGCSDFATIDGGMIFGSDEWTREAILRWLPDRNAARRHSKLTRAVFGTMPPRDVLVAVLKNARRHSAAMELVQPHLYFWLSEMLDDEPLVNAVLDCMFQRAPLTWISRRMEIADSA